MKSSFIKFLWFLFRNGALIKFMRNLDAPLRTVNNSSSTIYYILGAFLWSNTPEGVKYWYDLNRKWINDAT